MNLASKVVAPPHVIARDLGDGAVILDLATGTYHGLDPVGARVWALLLEGRTLSTVCDVMASEYEVSRVELEQDVLRLVGDLVEQKLVEPA